MCDFGEWTLRGGKADALERASAEMLEPLKGERKMSSALGGDESVDFIDDDGFNRTQHLARVGGEKQVERLGRGDEYVGGHALETGTLGGGSVSGAHEGRGAMERVTAKGGDLGDFLKRNAQVAFDIDGEGFEGRKVKGAAALSFGRRRRKHSAI
jgi:hypothetical protein